VETLHRPKHTKNRTLEQFPNEPHQTNSIQLLQKKTEASDLSRSRKSVRTTLCGNPDREKGTAAGNKNPTPDEETGDQRTEQRRMRRAQRSGGVSILDLSGTEHVREKNQRQNQPGGKPDQRQRNKTRQTSCTSGRTRPGSGPRLGAGEEERKLGTDRRQTKSQIVKNLEIQQTGEKLGSAPARAKTKSTGEQSRAKEKQATRTYGSDLANLNNKKHK
jgi:hypothetical protein